MNNGIEFLSRAMFMGIGATLIMDLWATILRQFGIPSLNFAFLGRWIGHIPRGRWFHEAISKSEPIPGEKALGWLAHYSIGIAFAALLLAVFGLPWGRNPTFLPALGIGLMTVVAPLFILQPALGAGMASAKTARPLFNSLKSVVTHLIFGAGLFVSARLAVTLFTINPLK